MEEQEELVVEAQDRLDLAQVHPVKDRVPVVEPDQASAQELEVNPPESLEHCQFCSSHHLLLRTTCNNQCTCDSDEACGLLAGNTNPEYSDTEVIVAIGNVSGNYCHEAHREPVPEHSHACYDHQNSIEYLVQHIA